MSAHPQDPCLFVLFGATGDLARRKLLPALGRSIKEGRINNRCHVLGVTPQTDQDDASFRALARASLEKEGLLDEVTEAFVAANFHFQTIGKSQPDDFAALRSRLLALEADCSLPGNRAFYLAIPPRFFASTITTLGEAGLNHSAGWTRLVVEKPFGKDLQSARALNEVMHRHFKEPQIYRIDHYLGKDTVQNLLVFRFANALFESAWNRDRIMAVELLAAESLGVGTRAGYYDHAGALRDMVQNHMTQLLTLTAMEPPSDFKADAIRYEKIKVLRSIAPLSPSDVVRGQYTAGSVDGAKVPGYLEADGVANGSDTESFVAMKLLIDNWRWQGVPFYLRTGKRLGRRLTRIAVRFRDVPVSLFRNMGVAMDSTDILLITLQPDEGFSLHLDIKKPGEPFEMRRVPLSFQYKDIFGPMPPAYQTLLLDVLEGDQTLFVHADEVEESWRIYAPALVQPPAVVPYAAGSWGPEAARSLGLPERHLIESEQ